MQIWPTPTLTIMLVCAADTGSSPGQRLQLSQSSEHGTLQTLGSGEISSLWLAKVSVISWSKEMTQSHKAAAPVHKATSSKSNRPRDPHHDDPCLRALPLSREKRFMLKLVQKLFLISFLKLSQTLCYSAGCTLTEVTRAEQQTVGLVISTLGKLLLHVCVQKCV